MVPRSMKHECHVSRRFYIFISISYDSYRNSFKNIEAGVLCILEACHYVRYAIQDVLVIKNNKYLHAKPIIYINQRANFLD